jgi:hypothetical protein
MTKRRVREIKKMLDSDPDPELKFLKSLWGLGTEEE